MSSITFTPKSKLKKLSNNAFSSCPLTTFTIPAEVNSFVGSVFGSIKSIESIIVDKENQNFVGDELNRYVLNSQKTTLIYFASAITGCFSVPDGVTLIEHAAFGGTNLDSIELPNSVTQISQYAFYSAKISSIRLPDTIKSIGQCAFYSTPYLKAIKLPSSLQTLETLLFADSGIVSITIPDSVTTIKDSAFAGCHQLQNVVLPKNLQTIGGNVFPSSHYVNFEFGGDSSIYINSQSLLMDKNNTYISLYLGSGQDTITIPSTVKTIKDSAFRWRSNIRSVTCSGESQLERIESYAFQNCINLNSFFNFPNIKYISAYAFANTKFPNSLSFGSEFYKVEEGAFLNCSFIPSVSFSSSVQLVIGVKSFYQCTSITSLAFDCTDTIRISDESFFGISLLKSVNLPNNIVSYGSYCFSMCGLETVTFDDNTIGVSSLSTGMFKDCSNLSNILIPSNINLIGAFSLSNISVTKLHIPDNVEELSIQCFKSCENLVSINISSNSHLRSINFGVFEGCRLFREITPFKNSFFKTDYGALYDSDLTRMIIYPPASPARYFALAYSITSIADSAFMGCTNLETILIPDNTVTSIGRSAFEGCVNLKHINIPLSVVSIGDNSFIGCRSLHCGSILIQNKTSSFRSQLYRAGVQLISLSSCERITCRSTYYTLQYFFFAVFIII